MDILALEKCVKENEELRHGIASAQGRLNDADTEVVVYKICRFQQVGRVYISCV